MKNSIITSAIALAIFVVTGVNSFGQKGLYIGIEGTPQFSRLFNADDNRSDDFERFGTFNANFGITSHFGFTEYFGVGANLLYSFQGQRYGWRDMDLSKKLQYVKIPLTVDLRLPMFFYTWYLKAGPQFAFLTNAKIDEWEGGEFVSDQGDAYLNMEFGGVVQIGSEFELSNQLSLDVAVRGDAGFTNAEDEDYSLNIHNPRDMVFPSPGGASRAMTSNMTLGISFGVKYKLL